MFLQQFLRALVRANLVIAVLDDTCNGKIRQAFHAVAESFEAQPMPEDLAASHDESYRGFLAEENLQEGTGRLTAVKVIAADIGAALRAVDIADDGDDEDAISHERINGSRDAGIVNGADD